VTDFYDIVNEIFVTKKEFYTFFFEGKKEIYTNYPYFFLNSGIAVARNASCRSAPAYKVY